MMSRVDPYGQSLREEQKAVINALLGIIYDNYETTRRIQDRVDSIYRAVFVLLFIVVALIVIGGCLACYFGCQRVQRERHLSLHQPGTAGRKPAPIEI